MTIYRELRSKRNYWRFVVCAFLLSLVGTETAFASEDSATPVSSPVADAEATAQDLSAFDVEDGRSLLQEAAEFATGLENIETADGTTDLPDELTTNEFQINSKDSAEIAVALSGDYDLNLLDNPLLVGTMSENIPRP